MTLSTTLDKAEIQNKTDNQVISQLAQAIADSQFLDPKATSDYVSLQGLDHDIYKPTTQHLFLTFSGSQEVRIIGQSIQFQKNVCITAGTLRNSFYVEPWRQLTKLKPLFLKVKSKGTVRFRIYQVSLGHLPEMIASHTLKSEEIQTNHLQLPDLQDYPKNCRLFWDVVCESDTAELYDVAYETKDLPVTEGRLVVLLRTFGRTQDIAKLLDKFNTDAQRPEYQDLFNRLYFVVLDTSANIDEHYAQKTWSHLNIAALKSANLGGGGNVSHMLYMVSSAFEQLSAEPDDLLIMDDDLEISTESLRRYAAFCRYRSQEVVCSLPVLMKSEPTVLWEDGGYWGKLNPNEEMSMQRRSLFPTLLRHGWRFKGFDHLDEMASLNFCEYSTFIFFGLSYKLFKTLGYPTAFFLRGDDIEYSLRLNAAGYRLFTNPNLCAWHEPAHSYVQEYMAIMHGLMINLSYGGDQLKDYIDFFEKRIADHSSVGDDLGLTVYAEILKTLTQDTSVFELDFQSHYLDKFKFFKQLGNHYKYLSPFIIEQIHAKHGEIPQTSDQKAKPQGTLIVPFIHMGDRSHLKFQSVLLYNPHSQLYYHIDMENLDHRRKLIQKKSEIYQVLATFIEKYDIIVNNWVTKMTRTQQENFWVEIHQKYQQESVLLSSSHYSESEEVKAAEVSVIPQDSEAESSEIYMQSENDIGSEFLPEDFDVAGYLKLNKDVAEDGQDAIRHYLLYGRYEGRVWK